jgi:hypothetical protein
MSDVRSFHMTTARRINDHLMRPLIRLGVVPGTYLLTVRGRKTGIPRSNPVTLVDGDQGRRWLVAPYGDVGWVRNARGRAGDLDPSGAWRGVHPPGGLAGRGRRGAQGLCVTGEGHASVLRGTS